MASGRRVNNMIAHTNMPLDFKPKPLIQLKPEMTVEEMDAYEKQEAELAKETKPRIRLKTEMTVEEMDAYEKQEAELKASFLADTAIAGAREAAGNIVKGIGGFADATDPQHLFMSDEEDKAFNEMGAKTGLQAIGDSIKVPRAEYELAKEKSPISTAVGEIGTEVASFLIPGARAAKLASTGGRIAAQAGVGATASGLVSSGKGNTGEEVFKDVMVGGVLGGVGQGVGEVLSKIAIPSGEVAKDVAKDVSNKLSEIRVNKAGKPVEKLAEVLKNNKTSIDAFQKHLSSNFSEEGGDVLSKAILDSVGVDTNSLNATQRGHIVSETLTKNIGKLSPNASKIKAGVQSFAEQQAAHEKIVNKLFDNQISATTNVPDAFNDVITEVTNSLKTGTYNTTQSNTMKRVKDALSSNNQSNITALRDSLSKSSSKFDRDYLEKIDRALFPDVYDDIMSLKTAPTSDFAKLVFNKNKSDDDLVRVILASPGKYSAKDLSEIADYTKTFEKVGLDGLLEDDKLVNDTAKHGWSNLQKKLTQSLINSAKTDGDIIDNKLLVTNLNKFGDDRLKAIMSPSEFNLYKTIKALPKETVKPVGRVEGLKDKILSKDNRQALVVDAVTLATGGTPMASILKAILKTKHDVDGKVYSAIDDLVKQQSKTTSTIPRKYIAPVITTPAGAQLSKKEERK
jgi:hypothetical protein